MGKTALGWAFAERVPRAVWMEIGPGANLGAFAESLARSTGERAADPDQAESVGAALGHLFAGERKLLVLDGYADVEDAVVDALAGFLRGSHGRGKLLVLAQESTPVYCRFYAKADVDGGRVAEWHLRGLDLEGCRAMLRRVTIDPEALRRGVLPPQRRHPHLPGDRRRGGETPRGPRRLSTSQERLLLLSGRRARRNPR